MTVPMLAGRKHAYFCLLLCLLVLQVASWIPTQRSLLNVRASINNRKTVLQAESAASPIITGKDIYQRVFYRLSSYSEVDVHNAIVVEELVRFNPDEANEGYLKPVGPRTLILRDGKVEEGEIGDELFRLNVHETEGDEAKQQHSGAGTSRALEATIATILYLAANPKFCKGDVLEVGCDIGLASLLGCIAAGKLDPSGTSSPGDSGGDDILTIPTKSATMSGDINMLTLSDASEDRLNIAFHNVKYSNVPSNKVTMEEFDWRKRSLKRTSPKVFHTIVASDLDYTFPEAKELAHAVAHRLQATSTWEFEKGDSKSPPTFVHVCPDARDEVANFQRFLTKGYRMNASSHYVKLEKLSFAFQMLPEGEPEIKLDDLDLEVQELKDSFYQALTATHHPDYADGAGEMFFPMETGEYDSLGGQTYLETDTGRGGPW